MVTCDWMGRLGNIMFQIAVTESLAIKHNDKAEYKWQPYFDLPIRSRNPANYHVQPMGDNSAKEIEYKANLSIVGFFQRHEYFDSIRDHLIKNIFKVPMDWQPNTIAVHVRRGDFLYDTENFPVQPVSYYMECLEKLDYKNKKVVFCSDDIPWCKENFPFAEFRENTTAVNDIFFGANCDSVIMSNSTFSFWMGYLSMRNRPIYYPLHWFSKNSGRNGSEICLPEWIGV
jgi:Glycosyl transferase family 11